MARPLRLFFESAFYHITARVNQREGILRAGSVKQLEDYPWSSYVENPKFQNLPNTFYNRKL